jgi:6-phosphogluconolactonase
LSQYDINWAQVSIGLVDERFVSPNDSHSNERMIKNTLLQGKASKAKFIGLVYDTDNLAANLDIALANNKPFLEGISCVILGMGSDGHTASLFPNDEASLQSLVEKKSAQPLLVTNAPSAPQIRISYTKEQLLKTSKLFLYFTGDEKMKVFSKAKMDNNPDITPISSFIHQNEKLLEVFWTS